MDLPEREARSRDELVCPACRTEGLERYDAFARRQDTPRERLKNGTRCPNCQQRVDPEKLEEQLAAPTWSIGSYEVSVPEPLEDISRQSIAVGLALLAGVILLIWIPQLGPILGGSQASTGPANASTNNSTQPAGNGSASDGWKIYWKDGGYIATNGTHFVGPDGPQDDPFVFESLLDLLNLLGDSGDGSGADGNATVVTTDGNWTITNGDGGFQVTNGTHYLGPDGLRDTSYTWSTWDDAASRLSEFLTQSPSGGSGGSGGTYQTPESPSGSGPSDGLQTPSDGGDDPGGTQTDSPDDDDDQQRVIEYDGGGGGGFNPVPGPSSGGGGGGGGSDGPNEQTDGPTTGTTDDIPPLHGQVLDANGDPVTGATVTITDLDRSLTTSGDGSYEYSSSIPTGTHTLYAYNATHTMAPVEFTVLDDGSVQVGGSPSQAVFVRDGDSISQNRLTLIVSPRRRISVAGMGSNLTTNITFEQLDNAAETNVTLGPVYTGQRTYKRVSAATTLPIDGNRKPKTQLLSLTGSPVEAQRFRNATYSSTTTDTLDVDGNSNPTAVDFLLRENTQRSAHERAGTWSGSSLTVDANGNLDPVDSTLQLTGTRIHRELRTFSDNSEEAGLYNCNQESSQTNTVSLDDGQYTFDAEGYMEATEDGHAVVRVQVKSVWESSSYNEYVDRMMTGTETKTHYDREFELRPHDGTKTRNLGFNVDVDHPQGDLKVQTYVETCRGEASVTNQALTQTKTTGKVTVEANGDSHQTAALGEGDTETVPLTLEPGENTVDISTTGADTVDYTVEYTSRTAVESPTIRHDGTVLCQHDGVLLSNKTCSVSAGVLESGANDIAVERAAGTVMANLSYTAHAKPTDVTVEIGGEQVTWSEFDGGQYIPSGGSSQLDINAIAPGENDIRVRGVPSVDGMQPDVTANLTYDATPYQTAQTAVVVTAPSGATHRTSIADENLTDGLLYQNVTLGLPQSWFETGENEVRVVTADDSLVAAELNASGLTQQVTRFEKESG